MVRIKKKARQSAAEVKIDCTALYTRVSTEIQATEGYSLADQKERLEAYCKAQGWPMTEEHIYKDEGVSGKTTDRPQFQAMLEAAKAGRINRIVAMKLDRMARNVREFLATIDQLKEWGCDLVLVKDSFDTSTPQGRFTVTMFAALAELEAGTITERMMSGKSTKARLGGFNGGPCPLGYHYTGKVFEITKDAETVKTIFRLFVDGWSLTEIANEMTSQGVATQKGKRWFPMTVRQILLHGAYCGLAQWDGQEAPGKFPPIIPQELYEQAQVRLQALRPGKVPLMATQSESDGDSIGEGPPLDA